MEAAVAVGVVTAEAQATVAGAVTAVRAVVTQEPAAIVSADAATVQEWPKGGATVWPAAAALDVATPALGTRGTTVYQRGVPIRNPLRTKGELTTAEASPPTPTRGNL
jgi:hypothetical protein